MANGIDTAIERMKSSRGKSVVYGASTDPESEKLTAGDDAVLGSR